MRILALLGGVLLMLSLSACADRARFLDSDPGVYDGQSDPLTDTSGRDRSDALADRFKLIQDR